MALTAWLRRSEVGPGSTVTLIVTSNGAINLSGITQQQVSFIDFSLGAGAPSNLGTRKIEATARKLTVTGGLGNITPPFPESVFGQRQMHLIFGDPSNLGDATIVTFTFTIVPPFVCPPSCQLPNICVDKKCVLPPTKCKPRCPITKVCNEKLKRCEFPK
jgi:hypothetical protein